MNIRRLILLVLALCNMIILSSCEWDRHVGERPIDQPNTKWVSSEPSIWFEVPEQNDRWCNGEIELDGEIISVIVFFDYRTSISVRTSRKEKSTILYGECEFGEDTLTVTVFTDDYPDKHPLYQLDESIQTVTFQRET